MKASKLPTNPKTGIKTILNQLFNSPARAGKKRKKRRKEVMRY